MSKNVKEMTRDELNDYVQKLEERLYVNTAKIERAEKENNIDEVQGLSTLLLNMNKAKEEAENELASRNDNQRGNFDIRKVFSRDGSSGENGAGSAFNPAASFECRYNDGAENRTGNGKNEKEVRAFQKFVTSGGMYGITAEEARAMNTSGAAAVIPTDIYMGMITDKKYSDLLHRANQIHNGAPGKMYIPIASGNSAEWHEENAEITDGTPKLDKIELGGYELVSIAQVSAATSSMSVDAFMNYMAKLLGDTVIEKLENAFINGTGSKQPKGLVNLDWATSGSGQNAIVTAASANISYTDIAAGLALLPQMYGRNAVILANAKTAYQTIAAEYDDNGKPVHDIGTMPTQIFGHEIVITEHMADDTVFVVDPRELYVRFSAPMQVEIDRSRGFTSASIYIRSLAVVDAAWNPAACVRITKGA